MNESMRILIIDDDAYVRRLTCKVLNFYTSIPLEINEVANGLEGINFISNRDELPDVILLDINMPIMSGAEFLVVYKDLPLPEKKPAVYVLSTDTRSFHAKEITQHGIVKGFFEKPLTVEDCKDIFSPFE